MPACCGKTRQKRHYFLFCFLIKIKTKLTAFFSFKHLFDVDNRRNRMLNNSGNLFDSRGKAIDKYTFI